MICHEIKELTVAYLELDLEPAQVAKVTTHLEGCPACRTEMETVRQVLVRLRGLTVPDPGAEFWSGFPAMVRVRLARAKRSLASVPASADRHSRERFRIGWRWSLAVAASVVLLVGAWLLVTLHDTTTSSRQQAQVSFPAYMGSDLPELLADWEKTGDEDDPDGLLVELAARLDQGTLDRIFQDI